MVRYFKGWMEQLRWQRLLPFQKLAEMLLDHFDGILNYCRTKVALEGLGKLGGDQLAWMKDDLQGRPSGTPVIVFAHIPLWSVYPQWGWGTEDGAEALSYLKRFGSVTVLNGHIHQVMQKIEGNVTFHTAMSTAFPQPAPGSAPSPGPMKVPAERLRTVLGVADVRFQRGNHSLAIVDSPLVLASTMGSTDRYALAGKA